MVVTVQFVEFTFDFIEKFEFPWFKSSNRSISLVTDVVYVRVNRAEDRRMGF